MIIDIPFDIIKLFIALVCGIIVGIERTTYKKPAGLRTYALVCVGSAMFTILSSQLGGDPARVASHVVVGIGFLGAGTIWRTRNTVTGLTTAAGLWTTSAIGMAIGIGQYIFAGVATILVVFSFILLGRINKRNKIKGKKKIKKNEKEDNSVIYKNFH